MSKSMISLTVNGEAADGLVEPRRTLADFLRLVDEGRAFHGALLKLVGQPCCKGRNGLPPRLTELIPDVPTEQR